jgi:hypothetical protein
MPAPSTNGPRALFASVVAVAFVFYLWNARHLWFFQDDWDYFAHRSLTSADDLLRPHNEHWTTIPIVVYRTLYATVGLHSYLPYALVTIVLHLVLATLLLVLMLRLDITPWIAAIVASVFALFGAAAYDILWSFQIGFEAALVFGLTHLLLMDHQGGLGRRDVFGVLAGVAALMSSGIGVTMAVVVGLAALLRRGWRVAVVHVAPLGLVYGWWWLAYGRKAKSQLRGGPIELARFAEVGLRATFDALGDFWGGGAVIVVVLLGGLAVAVAARPHGFPQRAAIPMAMFAGAIVSFATVAVARDAFGPSFATKARYLHVAAVLILPAFALGVDALTRRWRVTGAIALGALVLGVPGNVRAVGEFVDDRKLFDAESKSVVLTVAQSPLAATVPAGWNPEPSHSPMLSMGWIRDAYAQGRLPHVDVPPEVAAANVVRLSLWMNGQDLPEHDCAAVRQVMPVRLRAGEGLLLRGPVFVRLRTRDGVVSRRVRYDVGHSTALLALRALDLRVSSVSPGAPSTVCRFVPRR